MKTHSGVRTLLVACAVLTSMLLSSPASAQTGSTPPTAVAGAPSDNAAVHNELRQLRDEMLDAWKRRDIDALLSHVDPNIVVTWQNGDVSRGPDAIRKFYSEMLLGPDSILSNMDTKLTVDDLSVLHGPDTAIAFGSTHDDMTFRRSVGAGALLGAGKTLGLTSRWTATLVRKGGEWKVAAYHVSANVFSNPIQDLAVKAAGRVGAIGGFVVGAIVVLLVGWVRRRSRTQTA
jgi:ketosteroid isomerase-like protein